MAFLKIFRRKPKERKKEKIKEIEKREKTRKKEAEVILERKKEERKKKKPSEVHRPKKLSQSRIAWRVLESPYITEKSTGLVEKNQYVFKIYPRANKVEVKRAIEDLYGVKVEKVRIVKIPSKKRRLGRIEGKKKGFKKAIVKLKEGQTIEVLPR
jgi:large subunit ribosomal protein L23